MNNAQNTITERTALIQDAIRWAWYFVLAGFCLAFYGIFKATFSKDGFSLAGLSELGSYFQGAVGSTWTLAGLLFIYASFVSQREQMARQQVELEDQRKHFEAERADQQKQIEAQRQQFEAQQESFKRQNFESSFFQLLNLQNHIATSLHLRAPPGFQIVTHRECFQIWHNQLGVEYKRQKEAMPQRNELGHIKEAYHVFYRSVQDSLAQYFRNLYHIIKFVKTSDVQDKRRYTSLARAQLSAYELTLLFYNGLSVFGERFKPLIEEFGLLEHLDDSLLMERSHRQLYPASAYQ